jgi:hypothetical protein
VAATTVYDLKVRVTLSDQASKGVAAVGRSASRSAVGIASLTKSVLRLRNILAGGLAVKVFKDNIIDAAAGVEQTQTALAGILRLQFGESLGNSVKKAGEFVRQLSQDAEKSTEPIAEYVHLGKTLLPTLARQKVGLSDIREIVSGTATAAKALGLETEEAGAQLNRAFSGKAGRGDQLTQQLLASVGVSQKQFNKLMQVNSKRGIEILRRGLLHPAFAEVAALQDQTFNGVVSNIKAVFQNFFVKVGGPFIKVFAVELQKVVTYFEQNQTKITQFAHDFTSTLIRGLDVAAKVFSFIAEHKDLLMALAKAALITKVAGGLANTVGGFAGTSDKGLLGAVNGITKQLARGIIILGFVDAAANAVADIVLAGRDKELAAKSRGAGLASQFGDFRRRGVAATADEMRSAKALGVTTEALRAKNLLKTARSEGVVGGALGTDFKAAAAVQMFGVQEIDSRAAAVLASAKSVEDFGLLVRQQWENLGGTGDKLLQFSEGLSKAIALQNEFGLNLNYVPTMPGTKQGERKDSGGPPRISVNINRVEVTSDDPDRFAFNMVNAFQAYTKSPGQASNATRPG